MSGACLCWVHATHINAVHRGDQISYADAALNLRRHKKIRKRRRGIRIVSQSSPWQILHVTYDGLNHFNHGRFGEGAACPETTKARGEARWSENGDLYGN